MEIFFALLAGFILPLIIPLFFDRSREERERLAGMISGGYVALLGLSGAALVAYRALAHGVVGIGRRSNYASFMFSDQPVAATLALLVTLLCAVVFAALGWAWFKGSRDRTLGP